MAARVEAARMPVAPLAKLSTALWPVPRSRSTTSPKDRPNTGCAMIRGGGFKGMAHRQVIEGTLMG